MEAPGDFHREPRYTLDNLGRYTSPICVPDLVVHYLSNALKVPKYHYYTTALYYCTKNDCEYNVLIPSLKGNVNLTAKTYGIKMVQTRSREPLTIDNTNLSFRDCL